MDNNPEDQQKDNDEDKDSQHERLRQRLISKRPSDNHQCTICLNPIRDLSFADCCLHPFCRSCIIEWSKRSNNCPVCRTTFNNVLTNIQPDSNHDSIPIEPPPEMNGPVPFINIVRDIMVSPDGRSTVVRTRVINEEGTTEITEVRGTGRQSPLASIGPNPSSTNEGLSRFIGNLSAAPREQQQSAVETDEVDRFMGLLFRSLLSPEPLSAVSFAENPAQARITRMNSPGSVSSVRMGNQPRRPVPFPNVRPSFRPRGQHHAKTHPPMFPRVPKSVSPAMINRSKQTHKIIPQESLATVKTLPAQLSTQHSTSPKSSLFSLPPPQQHQPKSMSIGLTKSRFSKSLTQDQSRSNEEDQQQGQYQQRSRRIFGKNVPKSKDEQSENKKPPKPS
ncbi:uncharacterized protein LOC128396670 [Panonychus citri]|uniref:uncharacterized protein LOC128396670 n=1 Tax=Panonychus citri TaxID=50023 RepID=UPI002307593A|nr:uncharacterized protein LOC128396670 [Panonychus citri]